MPFRTSRKGLQTGIELPQRRLDLAAALTYGRRAAARGGRHPPGFTRQASERIRRRGCDWGASPPQVRAPDDRGRFFRRAVEDVRAEISRPTRQQDGTQPARPRPPSTMPPGSWRRPSASMRAIRIRCRHLAYCEYKLGRIEDARGHATAALALDPADTLAKRLARALRVTLALGLCHAAFCISPV